MASLTQKFLAALGAAATIFTVTPAFAGPEDGRGRVTVSAADNKGHDFSVSSPLNKDTQAECLAVADSVMTDPESPIRQGITGRYNLFMSDGGKKAGTLDFKNAMAVCGSKTRFCGEGDDGTVVCSTYSTVQP